MSIVLIQNYNYFPSADLTYLTPLEVLYKIKKYNLLPKSSEIAVGVEVETERRFKTVFQKTVEYLVQVAKPATEDKFVEIMKKYNLTLPEHICKQILSLKYANSKKDLTNYLHSKKITLSETALSTILSTKLLF